MTPFITHSGKVAVLWRDHVDTDQIIPKEFLKSVRRVGFGEHLFQDWRYLADGSDNREFELNRPEARGATILLTGNNFGCGSSREHAVWAIQQYGFAVVIAPQRQGQDGVVPAFADIFRGNALKNGLLTIEMPLEQVELLRSFVLQNSSQIVCVDLAQQHLTFGTQKISFAFEPASKEKLMQGLDDIGQTLLDVKSLENFEKRHDTQR